jgi:hypothetical protein
MTSSEPARRRWGPPRWRYYLRRIGLALTTAQRINCLKQMQRHKVRGLCEAMERYDALWNAADGVGKWLSAALDDPGVCAEMKADINALFDVMHPAGSAVENDEKTRISAAGGVPVDLPDFTDEQLDYITKIAERERTYDGSFVIGGPRKTP